MSVEALVAAVKAYAAANPAGPIVGRGWIETHWPEKRFPTRADLDRAVAARPVWLERADGHAAVGNSAALALGGVTRDTPAPKGGEILKGSDGEPTGMLVDNAMTLVDRKMPPLSGRAAGRGGAHRRRALRRARLDRHGQHERRRRRHDGDRGPGRARATCRSGSTTTSTSSPASGCWTKAPTPTPAAGCG